MSGTNIEYLDRTWNPIAMKCTPVSAGCARCWHLAMAKRHAANPRVWPEIREGRAGGKPRFVTNPPAHEWDEIQRPFHWHTPARIGTMFMGDLFHEEVTFEQMAAVFGVMAAADWHTFLVLTKRLDRAAEFFKWVREIAWPRLFGGKIPDYDVESKRRSAAVLQYVPGPHQDGQCRTCGRGRLCNVVRDDTPPEWPLPNVWFGASVEDQQAADERLPKLMLIPAALRFVSMEPLLGPIGISKWLPNTGDPGRKLDWVIAGAETGPGARTMDIGWARYAKDQCQAAGVPFFFKKDSDGGRVLDGRIWEQLPKEHRCG